MADSLARPQRRDVILIGGSQGAIRAAKTLLGALSTDLPAAIAITIHRGVTPTPMLAAILSRSCALPVTEAKHGEPFRIGRVYVAPPDRHLILRAGALWLDRGAKQHHLRPAVDPMFLSGAESYGARVIGVQLTGNLSDGVAGLVAIKQEGGLSLAQDPGEAEAPSMPRNAIAFDDVDLVFPVASVGRTLSELVHGEAVQTAAERLWDRVPARSGAAN
jgi:two-component system, chemotaxis family, protein-glutamate methylesterase/glutaminase